MSRRQVVAAAVIVIGLLIGGLAWYVLGGEVEAFEQEFARYCGTMHCVGVGNGLDALILSIEALDLPRGSDILVMIMTAAFGATGSAPAAQCDAAVATDGSSDRVLLI